MNNRGTTLIELIVAMSIASILLVFITRFMRTQNVTYETQIDTAELQQGIRVTRELIATEARRAGLDVRNVGFKPVDLDSAKLVIRADLNADGDTLDLEERIEYYRTGTVLMRRTYANGSVRSDDAVIDPVERFVVRYFAQNGVPAVSPDLVREINITMVVRSSRRLSAVAGGDGYQRDTTVFTVNPRNIAL